MVDLDRRIAKTCTKSEIFVWSINKFWKGLIKKKYMVVNQRDTRENCESTENLPRRKSTLPFGKKDFETEVWEEDSKD